MAARTDSHPTTAIRGPALTYTGDPFVDGLERTMRYESDAIIAMAGGTITHFGPAKDVRAQLPAGTHVQELGQDTLTLAGFIDCHVHYPQTQIIGAWGEQLIDWLDKYTFVAEQQFADKEHAREVARVFLEECLRAGTTTASVYCTVYPQSVDAFFEEAEVLGMRMIAGKILMDRNAPAALTDTPQQGYDESKALIGRWHGKGRLLYCVTPRFAPTSSPEQMDLTGALWREHPGTYLQSHVSENRGEVAWVQELYPERRGYLDVYEHYGQLGPRAIYGHGIWLTEEELQRCHETGTSIAHCPTSNQFLGSGLFNLRNAKKVDRPVRVGLATDIGAGTSFSILQTLNEAYKVAQLNGNSLSAGHAFYLATRGTAQALYLEDRIGSIAPGMEADLIVLDLKSTPVIEYRMRYCAHLEEALFIQMTMGDDRAVQATYVAGRLAYARPARVTGNRAALEGSPRSSGLSRRDNISSARRGTRCRRA
jgi:guanine deaminase